MGKIGYAFPIGTDGLRGGISYTSLGFHLGGEMATDPATLGSATDWNINLRYPLYRTSLTAVYLGATYDWKTAFNQSVGVTTSDKRVEVFGTSLTLEHTDDFLGGGFSQFQLGAATGRLDLSRVDQNLSDDQADTGAQTNGAYNKGSLQFVRIQRGTERLSFQIIAAGQISNKNLDGSEKFSLGGPTGVRAYPAGEGSGDQGYKVSVDAKYALASATVIGDLIGSIFYDYGLVQQNKNPTNLTLTTPNSYSLSGWGIGFDAVAAGKFTLKAGWAHSIGSNPGASATGNNSDGRPYRYRYWLLANVSF
jgi:hemolysin activation/secretion protein